MRFMLSTAVMIWRLPSACSLVAMFTWDATVDRFETVVRDAVARGRAA